MDFQSFSGFLRLREISLHPVQKKNIKHLLIFDNFWQDFGDIFRISRPFGQSPSHRGEPRRCGSLRSGSAFAASAACFVPMPGGRVLPHPASAASPQILRCGHSVVSVYLVISTDGRRGHGCTDGARDGADSVHRILTVLSFRFRRKTMKNFLNFHQLSERCYIRRT